jgi:hypothetical protein
MVVEIGLFFRNRSRGGPFPPASPPCVDLIYKIQKLKSPCQAPGPFLLMIFIVSCLIMLQRVHDMLLLLFYYSWNGGRAEAVCAGEKE